MVSHDSPWPNVSVRDFKGWGMKCMLENNVLFLIEFLFKPVRVFIL